MQKGVFVPGYLENTQAMLLRLRAVRNNLPMRNLPDARFEALANCAQEWIQKAEAIQSEVQDKADPDLYRLHGRNLELYQLYCDQARSAVYTAYDEPLAQAGARRSRQMGGFGKLGTAARTKYSPRDKETWKAIAAMIQGSKRHKAEVTAKRLKLPREAIESIRKVI